MKILSNDTPLCFAIIIGLLRLSNASKVALTTLCGLLPRSDLVKTLIELGILENDLFISDYTKNCYHPGRSGSINLKSEKGPLLAYFGEIHPAIIKKLDNQRKVFTHQIFKSLVGILLL